MLTPLFFAASFVYSSVGFGGGSSYIALLVLAGLSLYAVPSIALFLNIIVAGIALFNYTRAGHLELKFSIPFLSSVPFAFLAGLIVLPQKDLAWIFASTLFASSAALLVSGKKKTENKQTLFNKINWKRMAVIGIPVGSLLGVVAGLVGIGGGIWLSPLLILAGIQDTKRTAATASLFIVANSISGFLAHSIAAPIDYSLFVPLVLAVLAGGLAGSKFGAFKLDHDKLRTIVGAIVAVAGITLMFKAMT